jgi:hypothetical protein
MAKNQVSADVEFQGLVSQAPGAGVNNQSPFLQTGDMFSDYMAAFTAPATSSTLSSTLPAATVYVLGQRVVIPDTAFTVGASATSYLDLSNTGVLTVSTSGTVTANSLRLWSVVASATAITGVTPMANTQLVQRAINSYVDVNGTVQSVSNGVFTALIFPTKTYDTLGEYDTSSGSFTPKISGVYAVSLAIESTTAYSGTVPATCLIGLSAGSGTGVGRVFQTATSSGINSDTEGAVIIQLNGGVSYFFNLYFGAAITLDGGASSCRLAITRIS